MVKLLANPRKPVREGECDSRKDLTKHSNAMARSLHGKVYSETFGSIGLLRLKHVADVVLHYRKLQQNLLPRLKSLKASIVPAKLVATCSYSL